MPLLTKTQAIQRLKDATGLSEASSKAQIETLRTRLDGKRYKVHSRSVDILIEEFEKPEVSSVVLSERQIKKIRKSQHVGLRLVAG
jgi:hypothetical protein